MLSTIGISETSALASDSKKAKESAVSIFALLDRKSKIDSGTDEGLILQEVKGGIDFRHVSFKYPSRPDDQIFSDFTLHIPSGKVSLFLSLCNIQSFYNNVINSLLALWFQTDCRPCWGEW